MVSPRVLIDLTFTSCLRLDAQYLTYVFTTHVTLVNVRLTMMYLHYMLVKIVTLLLFLSASPHIKLKLIY